MVEKAYNYYLSLGSNIENEHKNILKAIEYLKNLKATKLKQSNFYLTKPQNYENQNDFLNICVFMDSELNPFDFLEKIKLIEKKMGRQVNFRFGPRIIDIDIIWIEGIKIVSNSLEVPHPRAFERAFVLHPLKELVNYDKELIKMIDDSMDSVKEQEVSMLSEFNLKKMY